MAATRKYAGLPDLDFDRDVYQTPDLIDDLSTIQATSSPSLSPHPSDDEAEEGIDSKKSSGIVRSRLQPTDARTRFGPERVDATGADFSDRLDGKKVFYKTSNRRRRRRRHWDGEDDGYFGDLTDEEDESVDRRLARLRAELEEVRMELAQKDAAEPVATLDSKKTEKDGSEDDVLTNISKLSQALDAVYLERYGESKGAELDLAKTIHQFGKAATSTNQEIGTISSAQPVRIATTSPTHRAELLQALSKAAEFDERLTSVEKNLGLNGKNMPDMGLITAKPILHTLATLDLSVQTVSNSTASIDAAQSKLKQLMKDAERFKNLKATQEEQYASPPGNASLRTNGNSPSSLKGDAERDSKINALYGTLSTIDSLAPTLPLVLDRLRTLRLLHTNAASASQTVDEMERRQSEQGEEIKQWREALDQVEKNLTSGEDSLTKNVKTVGEWVKDLEMRMAKFA